MMSCQKIQSVLSRYLAGDLPPWSRIAVIRHLDACAPCRRCVESHHRVALLVETVYRDGEEPPTGLWNRVMNEIVEETPGNERLPSTSKDWRPGIAVAAAGLAVGVFLGQRAGSPVADMSQAAAPYSVSHPLAVPAVGSYIQQRNRLALQDPLADQISLAAYVTAAYRDNEKFQESTRSKP